MIFYCRAVVREYDKDPPNVNKQKLQQDEY